MRILVDSEKLNSLIASRGLNPHTLSKLIGIPFTTLYRVCRGAHYVSAQNAKAISDGLGVSFDVLFRVGVKK